MIGEIVSHYRILDQLGEGGMGTVYLAEDTRLGRRVAIKFPAITSDEHHYHARFLREARAVSTLSHPHIAAIYDYGETDDGNPFLVMELVDGPSLTELLHNSTLTLTRSVEIIVNIAEALAEAHHQGIIHRDIKPSNVLLNHRNEVKVLDFGLAKQINEEQVQSADPDAQTMLAMRTLSGAVVGTPLYLSPEQAMCAPVDGRSDLFALGALLYECIAGRPAFNGTGAFEIAGQVIHINPPPPSAINPHVPPELDRITAKALAKKPEARYQSADEMIADLRAARGALSDEDEHLTQRLSIEQKTGRTSALMTLSDTLRRPRLSIGFFLVAIMLPLLLLSIYWWWSRQKPHVPSAEAQHWYEIGTNALRDGAYYQASKALEQAIKADDKFALAHARLAEAWTELDYSDKAKDEMLQVSALVHNRSVLPPMEELYLQGITATVTRNFTDAVESYRQIAQQATDIEKPRVYVDLGRAYEKNEEVKKAIESYVEATERAPQYATPFLRLGVLYARNQELASASAVFDKAEALYQALGNIEGRTEVFYQRGFLFNKIGRIAEARRQLQQALAMARTTGNQYQQINTLLQLSSVAYAENEIAQAKQYAHDAVDLARANDMENLIARGLVDLGNVYFAHGDYGEAEGYFKQALEFAQRYNGRRNEARARLSLGSLLIQQGRTDEGVRYVEQALAFYQQGSYRKEAAQALLLIGRANLQKGNYDAALKSFQQQLQFAEQIGDPEEIFFTQESIGTVLALQERYTEALDYFQKSYAGGKSLGDQLKIATTLADRGDVRWRLGHYEEARAALDEASALADQPSGGYQALLATIYATKGEIALSQRRFPEAEAQSRRALGMADKQTNIYVQAKLILGMAQSLSGVKNEGMQSCREAAEMATGMGDPWLLSKAQLAFAEALLENGDAPRALTTALQAQESFARSGQQESEWRAWLVAARAAQRTGDGTKAQGYASRAADLLSNLPQRWGSEVDSYLTRPDVQYSRKQLSEEFKVGS